MLQSTRLYYTKARPVAGCRIMKTVLDWTVLRTVFDCTGLYYTVLQTVRGLYCILLYCTED